MFGVGSIPWSPLARGVLTRPTSANDSTTRSQTDPWAKGYVGTGTADIVARSVYSLLPNICPTDRRPFLSFSSYPNRVEELAKKKNATMAQISVAWCLAKDGVTAPIVGTTKLENLKEIIGTSHPYFYTP